MIFFRLMVFGIVHQLCCVVPGHDVAWVIAVPHQHCAFEHFEQTGAAVHPGLCKRSMQLTEDGDREECEN
jgi:hypothetical protein